MSPQYPDHHWIEPDDTFCGTIAGHDVWVGPSSTTSNGRRTQDYWVSLGFDDGTFVFNLEEDNPCFPEELLLFIRAHKALIS